MIKKDDNMKSLKDALRDGELKLLSNSLDYSDNIPNLIEGIDEKYLENKLLKYFDGSITDEEHQGILPEWDARKLYDKYIFNNNDSWEKMRIDDDDVKNLIFLRLTLSEESKYLEQFDKLMLRIYFEKKEVELFGLSLDIYKKYDWAKEYVKARGKNLHLIFRKECPEYKRVYGIAVKNISEPEEEEKSTAKKMEGSKDWILSKFGGE